MHFPVHPTKAKQGASLVVTLLVITILTVIVVAFLQSMQVERATARSHSNAFSAHLAADAAVQSFSDLLKRNTKTDDFAVIKTSTTEPDYYYLATFSKDQPDQAFLAPLFSGGTPSTQPSLMVLDVAFESGLIPLTLSDVPSQSVQSEAPEARWVELRNSEGKLTGRYAFWAEDLAGYLNLAFVGNADGEAGSHLRDMGVNAREIALFSLFDPSTSASQAPEAARLVQLRDAGALVASRTALEEIGRPDELKYTYFNFLSDQDEQSTIPHFRGYETAGALKWNINTLLEESNKVDLIASVINDNLPSFKDARKGGFPDDLDYTKSIAAGIVDHVSDSPLLAVGVDYFSSSRAPSVNKMFHRFELFPNNIPPPSLVTNAELKMQTFVEIWNPFNQRLTGKLTVEIDYKQEITFNGPKEVSTHEAFTVDVDLAPNEFWVFEALPLATTALASTVPVAIKSTTANPGIVPQFIQSFETTFRLWWNDEERDGLPYQQARGGMERTASQMQANLSARQWKGNNSPHVDRENGQFGDPRAWNFIDTWCFANSYASNASFGGRSLMRGITNESYNEVLLDLWPSGARNSEAGLKPPTVAWTPDARNGNPVIRYYRNSDGEINPDETFPPVQEDLAPIKLSNDTIYSNICEIGFVFDPAQFTDVTADEALASPDSSAGGGLSLAVGRAEFPIFPEAVDSNRLLDIFSTALTRSTAGLINVNTAPEEVLRLLFAGIQHKFDTEATPSEIRPPTDTREADIIARAIINARPFTSLSEITQIENGNGNVFGNPKQWQGASKPDLSDVGLKEIFHRSHQLLNTRSRDFRVFILGQAVTEQPNGDIIVNATASRIVHIFAQSERDLVNIQPGSIPPPAQITPILYETLHP